MQLTRNAFILRFLIDWKYLFTRNCQTALTVNVICCLVDYGRMNYRCSSFKRITAHYKAKH